LEERGWGRGMEGGRGWGVLRRMGDMESYRCIVIDFGKLKFWYMCG